MTKSECVKKARELNHSAINYRADGRVITAMGVRAVRDGYMVRAREPFIVGPGY